ncbi:MAG: SpoIID/LytB domain-containing protein [Candidatus Longimicrobiales bacterium M2_2A_002]
MRPTRAWLVPVVAWLGACTLAGPRPGPGVPDRGGRAPASIPEGPAADRIAAGLPPEVRIGIAVDAPSVEVATDGRVELAEESGRVRDDGAGPWTVTRSGGRLEASGPTGRVSTDDALVVRPLEGRVRIDGTAYDGAVLLRASATGVTAVNLLGLERYLEGVVPLEIGIGRPIEELEAVKAQAIAARTYAVRHFGRREALGFDYYGSVLDQAYGGADAADEVASRAVRETRGMILTYDGEPIEAFYHSTCGGRTAALEEVWRGEPRPYLRSVSDRAPDGGWYCEDSSRFEWTEEWDEARLLETLTAGLRDRGIGPVSAVYEVEVRGRTRSGRAETLEIRTDAGDTRVFGDSIRRVLSPEPGRLLNSTAIEVETRGGDRVTGLVIHGSGWGHGIGMCQNGALGRARGGHDYRDILTTYYPGTRLVRLY